MYNKVVLMGRLTRDVELKTTPNGTPVATFSIAVDRSYSTKDGEKQVDFFNIVAWRHTAEFVSRFFSKGRAILIEGEIQNRKYTDKNGNEKQVTEIIANQARFTGEPKAEQKSTVIQYSAETIQSTAEDVSRTVSGDMYNSPF